MVTTSTSYPLFLANSFPLVSYHLLNSGFCSQWVQKTSFFCCAKLVLGIVTATITVARITTIHHPPRFMSSSLIPANSLTILDKTSAFDGPTAAFSRCDFACQGQSQGRAMPLGSEA